LFNDGKIYKGTDIVPWSGRSGTSYSQMEIIEGRKLVAHRSVFVKFPLLKRENENLLVWTTTPWTLTSNVAAAVNVGLDYVKLRTPDGALYYFAEDNLEFKRLEKQFKDKKQWIDGVPKLKTIAQIFKERGGYTIEGTVKGSELVGLTYAGPFDELQAQSEVGGFPFKKDDLESQNIDAINCHRVIDGGKDNIGNDIVVAGEGTGIVHIAPGCGGIDNKIGKKEALVEISPLDDTANFIDGFGWLSGKSATDYDTITEIIDNLKQKGTLVYVEKYPHVYPHCWRSGDELVYRCVDEWYINMDWRDRIKDTVNDIKWIPEWGNERELEWLENMGDWMISKKRFWGLALPIWTFEDGSHFVVGSKEELKKLAVEGWDEFEGQSPHRPWIDKVKIKHPKTGLVGTRIPDVGNPWLDAGIVPYSTLQYSENREYWDKWFPADFVVECFPGQFRNWFYSLLAMSTIMEDKAPFKTLLGHALVKDETGRDMHKSWGNAIWFGDAAEKMGVDVMRWLYAGQNPEHNLLFGYNLADEVRKNLITLWNTYSFFITYASLDGYDPQSDVVDKSNFTQLDSWILAKVNIFVKEADEYYENFQVFKLIKKATRLLDDISNWYVRRNRRRFWRSESDSDKTAAYYTLYTVLVKYIKVMSPIIPFLSEKMYQNLVVKSDKSAPSSIHLSDFPEFDESLSNDSLIHEVDTVINIVSLGRSARNKANIKIRQPLSEIVIYCDDKTKAEIDRNKDQVLEELNLKGLRFVDVDSDLVTYSIKPNFAVLGQKLGKEMKNAVAQIEQIPTSKVIEKLKHKSSIEISILGESVCLAADDLTVIEMPKDGFSVSSALSKIVGINTHISEELENEGIVRDLIRQVQNLRKNSGLKVEDRIKVELVCDKGIEVALAQNKSYFMSEVLALDLKYSSTSLEHKTSFKINDNLVELSIEVKA